MSLSIYHASTYLPDIPKIYTYSTCQCTRYIKGLWVGLPTASHILFGQRSGSDFMLPDPVYTGLSWHLDSFCQASDPVGLEWQPPADPSEKHHGCENSASGGGGTHPVASSHQSIGCWAGRSFLQKQNHWRDQFVLLNSAQIPGKGHLLLGSASLNLILNQNQPLFFLSKIVSLPCIFIFNGPNWYTLSRIGHI